MRTLLSLGGHFALRGGVRTLVPKQGRLVGKTVAYLAESKSSPSVDEQRIDLDLDDYVVTAGPLDFVKLDHALRQSGLKLVAGDTLKIFDLSCVALATKTLIGLLADLRQRGVSIEIRALGLRLDPSAGSEAGRLLTALDDHYRYVHGLKAHADESRSRGRKQLLDPARLPSIRAQLAQPGATATHVARELGVARSTLFNFLDRYDRTRKPGRRQKVVERGADNLGDGDHLTER